MLCTAGVEFCRRCTGGVEQGPTLRDGKLHGPDSTLRSPDKQELKPLYPFIPPGCARVIVIDFYDMLDQMVHLLRA
jgi:hypothetical protein